MNRRKALITAGAVAAPLLIAWVAVARRGEDDITYRFATVEQGAIRQTVSATGNLSAVKTVQVGTQVSGQVAEQFADFNDRVTRGQLLARIDPTLQQQAVRDAEAQLARSEAQAAQAQAEYERNAPLARERFISASEFGTVSVNRAVAQAAVKSARVTLDRARQNLAYTNIYAPISGVIVERNVDVGQTVAASLSAPQLFLIAQDLAQMQILASVDESDISSIRERQEVDFTVQSFQGRTFKGVVDQVRLQSKTTDNVVSYTVVVLLDNADGRLLPGMTATVEFITGSASNVLTVANSALRFRPSPEALEAAGLPATPGRDTTRRRGAGPGGGDSARTGQPAEGSSGGQGRRGGQGGPGATNAAGGFGGPGGGGGAAGQGGGARRRGGGSGFGVLYTVDDDGRLQQWRVRTGLSDGQRTQVAGDSVRAGLRVIVGSSGGAATTSAPSTNPLAPQRGGGGPGGGRGF